MSSFLFNESFAPSAPPVTPRSSNANEIYTSKKKKERKRNKKKERKRNKKKERKRKDQN